MEPLQRSGEPTQLFYGWIIVAVAFIVFMISYGLRYSFSVFFPSILQKIGEKESADILAC